ncbi:helix-turn-helix domain-containing protein [Phaeospirillum tilakii]|uniref:Helix-turn-helix domain-containing protein n=1 Tax=Phaeospirillum tilakii TaxID=741673 RepID=A0ABW5CEH5_9PROT
MNKRDANDTIPSGDSTGTGRRRKSTRGRLDDGSANPVDVHVGSRVRLRRTLLGMSQEKLGEAIGLTFQQVQKYERGANRIGSSRLFDLARILDVPISFFYDDMPDEVKAMSPVAVVRGDQAPAPTPTPDQDVLARRETLELVRAYYRIPDPRVRAQVYSLAKSLARSGEDDAPEQAERS